jgi:hypothetical protein
MCPTEEDSGVLMSSMLLYLNMLVGRGGKVGQQGLGKEPKSGAVDSEHGASESGSSHLCTESYYSK